jgi:hypothetical protein
MLQCVLGILFLYVLSRSYREPETPLPDVIIGPGGVLGFYTLGICHYLINHFDLSEKHIAGFSAGSFNTFFMRLRPDKRTFFLRGIFNCHVHSSIELLKKITTFIETHTVLEDYTLGKTSIAISHPEGCVLYDTFLNIKNAMRCCNSSSFVPFVTNDDVLNFYDHKISVDAYFLYGYFMQHYTTPPLVVSPGMFGRFSNPWCNNLLFLFGIHHLQYTSIYQMYLNGYHDATKNHAYFEAFLKPLTSIHPRTPPCEAPPVPPVPVPQTVPGSCTGSIPVS